MAKNYKYSYKLKPRGTSLSVCNVGLQRCEPGYRWGPGVRDHFLIHHVVAGKGRFMADGRSWPVTAGETFLVTPETMVSYQADQQQPWEYLWVGFRGNDARMLLAQTDFSPDRPVISAGSSDELKRMLLRVYERRGNRPQEAAAMTGYLYVFLSRLMELSRSRSNDEPGLELVRRATIFVQENYSHPITVEDVARFAGVSRSWLYRSFQQCLSVSPTRFLSECRMDHAAQLLQSSQLNVSEVACSVGYDDPYYFSRVFRQRFHCSPRDYLQKMREPS